MSMSLAEYSLQDMTLTPPMKFMRILLGHIIPRSGILQVLPIQVE